MENFNFEDIKKGNEPTQIYGEDERQIVNMDGRNFIADLTSKEVSFCSMTATTQEEKVKLYQATNNPAKRISDCINLEIHLKDVFVEVVNLVDEITGQQMKAPRIVLIDENGEGYTCVSIGVFSALKKIFTIFGVPTYKKPLTVIPTQITRGANKILTLNVK